MRFSTNKYYIYDDFKEDKWLVNEIDAQEIVNTMNNLDTKARERGKALSKLQKQNDFLKEENEKLKQELESFTPVIFNDMMKGTVILYNKKAEL